jgi:hypothetical protein
MELELEVEQSRDYRRSIVWVAARLRSRLIHNPELAVEVEHAARMREGLHHHNTVVSKGVLATQTPQVDPNRPDCPTAVTPASGVF